VKPVYSPHPVETSIYFFRSYWTEGYKTYAHCADIPSLETARKYLLNAPDKNDITEKLFYTFEKNLFSPADIKKIDIGGGLIHGRAEDFIKDTSSKIILSHTEKKLSDSQKEIGSNATFGLEDVLIPAHQDYSMQAAFQYLKTFYPHVPQADLDMILNCPVISFNVGLILIKKGVMTSHIFVILNGVVENIDSKAGFRTILSAGSILGEDCALTGKPPVVTCRAMSYVKALQIPADIYKEFIRRNFDVKDVYRVFTNRLFLQRTWLLGEMVSSMVQNTIAQLMVLKHYQKGENIVTGENPTIYMLKTGHIQVYLDDKIVDELSPGEFFGEESIFFNQASLLTAKATEESDVFIILGDVLKNKPIIEWKMLETFEKRLKAFGSQFTS
jgi:hemerythrin